MGLRTRRGCRRNQASDHTTVVIPRCCPANPHKGHLCTKSNAFCIDSSRHLPGHYLIRNHMVFHYNRILSAKAAVDCSVPKSRLCSIKFADQQRREKLKKKIARCKEKTCVCDAVPQSCSGDCRRLLPSSFRKSFLEVEDNLFPCARHAQCLSRASSPNGGHCLMHCSPAKHARKCPQNAHRTSCSHSNGCLSRPPIKLSGLSRSRSTESFTSAGCFQRCQRHNPKASSGDLLERHSEYFTKSQKPFTPRTLVSDAKSVLSDYRYYNPAQRRKKKNLCKHCVEAQTQTDKLSFPSGDKVCVRKVMSEDQKIPSKAEDKRCILDEPERGIDGLQYSIPRETSLCPQKCSLRRILSNVDPPLCSQKCSLRRIVDDGETSSCRQKCSLRRIVDDEETPLCPQKCSLRRLVDDEETSLCPQKCSLRRILSNADPPLCSQKCSLRRIVDDEEPPLCSQKCSLRRIVDDEETPSCPQKCSLRRIVDDEETALCPQKCSVRTIVSNAEKSSCPGKCSLRRLVDDEETSLYPLKCSLKRIVDDEEEELLYLTFIEDVTNEILKLGIFSNRVLDQLFECHIEANKNRLDEGKMRQMLDVLKSDLGCSQDCETELIQAGQEALDPLDLQEFDTIEELEFSSDGHRSLSKATKSDESHETLDLSLKEPSKCESRSWSERSRVTQSREDFSEDTTEITDAGTECDFCGEEFEECPDTSPTCEAALNSDACDSDLEASKELDELEEDFADSLHISHSY